MVRPKLKLRRALQAAGRMEELLPAMVEKLYEMFGSDEVDDNGRPLISAKEKLMIAKTFMQNAQIRERVADKLGIGTSGGGESKDNPMIAVFGGNVQVFRNLPPEKRQAMVLEYLKKGGSGTPPPATDAKAPLVITQPADPAADDPQDGFGPYHG